MSTEHLIESILLQNGIPPDDQNKFLNPEYESIAKTYSRFHQIEGAVDRVRSAIENKERVLIWGDFDVDGLTATSIMFRTLTHLGAKPKWHIPDRKSESHGLNRKDIERLCLKHQLMITVDCGIQNYQEVRYANLLGCSVIVTDHHTLEGRPPPCHSLLVPPPGLETEFSGAGVAFKFAQALLDDTDENRAFAKSLLWLACLGTVVDCVEQRNENRVISVLGLKQLNEKTPACIRALALETGMERPINKQQITWNLSPILNSASRLGMANVSAQILMEEESNTQKIVSLSKELGSINKERKEVLNTFYEKSNNPRTRKVGENYVLVVFNLALDGDARGVQGILAARLSEENGGKPTFVFTDIGQGLLVGSVRCPKHNFIKILNEMDDFIIGGGGHRNVGGLSMFIENITDLLTTLDAYVPLYKDELMPEKRVDLKLEEIDMDLYNSLAVFEPYEDGDSPLFSIKGKFEERPIEIGQNKTHSKFQITNGNVSYTVLFWGQAKQVKELIDNYAHNFGKHPEDIVIRARIKLNDWGGTSQIQLEATDLRLIPPDEK